jgi:hypothetical protein
MRYKFRIHHALRCPCFISIRLLACLGRLSIIISFYLHFLDLWPWKSIGFQILLRSKYVPSLVKIHWRMLILMFTRMLHGKKFTQWPWINILQCILTKLGTYLDLKRIWNPIDFQGQRSRSQGLIFRRGDIEGSWFYSVHKDAMR